MKSLHLFTSLLLHLFTSLLLVSCAPAAPVKFLWDALPPSEQIVQYTLLDQTGPDTYEEAGHADGTETHLTIDVPPGPHTYALMATNAEGERSVGDLLVLRTVTILLQSSSDLQTWTDEFRLQLPWADRRFYRIVFDSTP